MNREKESIWTLEPYVTNPTVCSVKLDANEGDKDLYLDYPYMSFLWYITVL